MLRFQIALIGLLALTACAPVADQAPQPTILDRVRSATDNPSPTLGRVPKIEMRSATSVPSATLDATLTSLPAATAAPTVTLGRVPKSGMRSATPAPTGIPDTRLLPEQWQEWPVIPTLSAHAKALYQAGLARGNNPQAFSKIGDCQNITSHFLGAFDDPRMYKLGPTFEPLQPAIHQFKGMFSRESAAVRGGFNVAAVLSPIQADPVVCQSGENPVTCELRLNRPSIVLISMETWWAKKPAQEYEKYMRQILDLVITQKALPILSTKADNLEGDYSVNASIARLAYEYDIPLWNFWKAAQALPGGGVSEDGFHLTHASDRPDDPLFYRRLSEPAAWTFGWPVRNVTALQALDSVWHAASQP
jgi:hypothetical protein